MTPFHYLQLCLGGWNGSMTAEAQGTILNREVEDCGENDRTSREMFPGSLIINEHHANLYCFSPDLLHKKEEYIHTLFNTTFDLWKWLFARQKSAEGHCLHGFQGY